MKISAEIIGALFILVIIIALLDNWLVRKQAKLEVRAQPRVPMFECEKHGILQEKHLITHLDQKICPYCFGERMKTKMDSTITGVN